MYSPLSAKQHKSATEKCRRFIFEDVSGLLSRLKSVEIVRDYTEINMSVLESRTIRTRISRLNSVEFVITLKLTLTNSTVQCCYLYMIS